MPYMSNHIIILEHAPQTDNVWPKQGLTQKKYCFESTSTDEMSRSLFSYDIMNVFVLLGQHSK